MTDRKLTGDKCQCPGCGQYFNSTYAFDTHRTGRHGVSRRCLTVEEMLASGMAQNKAGWWISRQKPVLPMRQGQNSGDRAAA